MNYYHDGCVKNASVINVGRIEACQCNPITITGNTVQYQQQNGRFGNANGTCSAEYGPITNETLALTNNLATKVGEFKFPSFDRVRPSCKDHADAGKQAEDKPAQPTAQDQCGEWFEKYNVVPFYTWGNTPKEVQPLWKKNDCNRLTCFYWRDKYEAVPEGTVGKSPPSGSRPDKLKAVWIHPQVGCQKMLRPSCNDLFESLKKADSCS